MSFPLDRSVTLRSPPFLPSFYEFGLDVSHHHSVIESKVHLDHGIRWW